MAKFVCKVCGYVYEGDAAPAECPVCHVGADMFEEVKGEGRVQSGDKKICLGRMQEELLRLRHQCFLAG